MAVAYLQSSFAPVDWTASATVRFQRDDTAQHVDWVVSSTDTYRSTDEMLAAWTAVIQADPNFGAAFQVVATHDKGTAVSTVQVTTGGPNYSITWSATGDGTQIRDYLGESGDIAGAADGSSFASHVPCSYVARWAARRIRRGSTSRDRAHFVATDGSTKTQHGHAPADTDRVEVDVELWAGLPTGANARAALQRIRDFVDALYSTTGAGEPMALYHGHEDDGSDAELWVLRWSSSPLRIIPERVEGSVPDRVFRIRFPALAEALPW